ncbi:MAG TPA: hypothetical protein PKA58_33165, partial [Polyangium sp.]|nr:hypothetical protein [Polyangium sp.]
MRQPQLEGVPGLGPEAPVPAPPMPPMALPPAPPDPLLELGPLPPDPTNSPDDELVVIIGGGVTH